jgi:hypothetical protein
MFYMDPMDKKGQCIYKNFGSYRSALGSINRLRVINPLSDWIEMTDKEIKEEGLEIINMDELSKLYSNMIVPPYGVTYLPNGNSFKFPRFSEELRLFLRDQFLKVSSFPNHMIAIEQVSAPDELPGIYYKIVLKDIE